MRGSYLLLAIITLAGCDNRGATPDWSRMITQPKLLPYGGSSLFDDGRAMRPLPAGTIPHDWVTDHDRRTGTNATGAYLDELPVAPTRALLARGRERFGIFCAACHGLAGDGDSAVAHNMERRRPPSLHEQRIVALAPGAVFHAISDGYGLMPAYAQELSLDDRWAVVAYVKTLQLSWTARLDALPEPVRARIAGRLE